MPISSPTEIASYRAREAEYVETIERLAGQLEARETELAALAVQLRVAEDAKGKLDDATTRLDQSERELATLKGEHAALKAQNAADGDAAAILANMLRKDVDEATWAAKLAVVRAAMEQNDSDNDALHMLPLIGAGRDQDRLAIRVLAEDKELDPVVLEDFRSLSAKTSELFEQLEQRQKAGIAGNYLSSEAITLDFTFSAIGAPPAGQQGHPPAAPTSPPPRKSDRSPERTKK